MRGRLVLNLLLAIGLASHAPAPAFACRSAVGDRSLFEERPEPEGLDGAEIVRVRFTNAPAAVAGLPRQSAAPGGDVLAYSLVGIARPIGPRGTRAAAYPVYAVVTSCSTFFTMATGGAGYPVIDGDYYLVGRLVSDDRGRRFLAGGNWNGRWHF